MDPLPLLVPVAETDRRPLLLPVPVAVPLAVWLPLTLADRLPRTLAVTLSVPVAVPLALIVRLAASDPVALEDPVELRETVVLLVPLRVKPAVHVPLLLVVCEPLPFELPDPVAVLLGDGLAGPACDRVAVLVEVRDVVVLALVVFDPPALPLLVEVPLTDLLPCRLLEAVGVSVPLGVWRGVAVCMGLADVVEDGLPVLDRDALAVGEGVPRQLKLAVLVPLPLFEAMVVRVDVVVPEADLELRTDRLAVELADALRETDTLEVLVRVTVAVFVALADDVPLRVLVILADGKELVEDVRDAVAERVTGWVA